MAKNATTATVSAEQKEWLSDLSIKVGSEADMKKSVLAYLKKENVDGVEDEEFSELLSMAHDIWLVEGEQGDEDVNLDDEEDAPVLKDVDLDEEEDVDLDLYDDDATLTEAAEETKTIRAAKKNTSTAKPLEKKVVKHAGKSERFDADVPEHVNMITAIFKKYFPAKSYELKVLKRGITVYSLAQNSKITFVSFDDVKVIEGKTLWGNLFCNRFKDVDQLKAVLPENIVSGHDIGFYASGVNVSIRGIDQAELINILSHKAFMEENVNRLNKKDKQMGANFEKLKQKTEEIDQSIPSKKAVKKAAVKEPEPDVEEEEDDVEEDAPVVPAKKAATTKVTQTGSKTVTVTTAKGVPAKKTDTKKK